MVRRPLNEHEKRMVDFVVSDDCFVLAVFDPEGVTPDFAYSIGFPATLDQPDVLISGLNLDLMEVLVNDVHDLCRSGLVMQDGARTDQLLSGYDCVFRQVTSENLVSEFWNSAIWYQESYRGETFDSAYQVVWPDKANRFSWEPGFDETTGGGQLKLWEGESVH